MEHDFIIKGYFADGSVNEVRCGWCFPSCGYLESNYEDDLNCIRYEIYDLSNMKLCVSWNR